MFGHSTHSKVWLLMFVIVLWKSIVVVKGPKRTFKEFSWTGFASFIMSLKIKKITISDNDQVLELLSPFIVYEDQSYARFPSLLKEAKIVE